MKYFVQNGVIKTEFPLDFEAILTCGQVFRYERYDGGYNVYSKDKKCFAKGNEIFSDDANYFVNYFDLNSDYDEYKKELSEFDELKDPIRVGGGIRILRQDLFETIISFIISANNNIPRIKRIIERMCEYCGVCCGDFYSFPSSDSLSRLSLSELRKLGVGFRDVYIQKTSRILTSDNFLKELEAAPTKEATNLLLTLPGVGPKVADCVLLFGLSRLDCFPVDTWIYKRCGNDELNTSQKVRSYYLNRYGSLAGLAQQYIFYSARND